MTGRQKTMRAFYSELIDLRIKLTKSAQKVDSEIGKAFEREDYSRLNFLLMKRTKARARLELINDLCEKTYL